MATIGDALPSPEAGWRRYEPESGIGSIFTSVGHSIFDYAADSGTTVRYNQIPGYLEFRFIGTKIRVTGLSQASYDQNIQIIIDGVTEIYGMLANGLHQALLYEKTGLDYAVHTVKINRITPYSGNQIHVDSIDIDSTGRLLLPNEVTDLNDLEIGKRIRCHYTATSGAFGVFSGLGLETSNFIPPASSATPNGDFYIIHVDDDHLGRKILIADRNIQHSISWDTLNTAGVASGSGLPIRIDNNDELSVKYVTRLLTGGTISGDIDNEWNKYIVSSTLNGTITPGNNAVWNWSGLYSSHSATPSGAGLADRRVIRGNTAVTAWTYTTAGTVAHGFRPVLLIENAENAATITKYLFQDGNDMKRYTGTAWEIVGVAPPTEEMFITNGMDDLSTLNYSALSQLGEINLNQWTNDNLVSKNLNYKAIPKPVLIKANNDLNLIDVENIDNFTITGNTSVNAIFKIIVSTDSGISWQTYNGTSWISVNTANLNDVKVNGISQSVFNSLTNTEWNLLLGSGKIRFAYYLELSNVNDLAESDLLTTQLDMKGKWKKAIHGTDYDYEYPLNTQLTITFLTNGGFKVNYYT